MHTPLLTSDVDIARHTAQFCDRTLPKADWTHAGHFAAALGLIERHGLPEVQRRMPAMIRAYNVATGGRNTDAEGYHETITQASLLAADAALAASRSMISALHDLLAGPAGRSDWLFSYWTRETLISTEARRQWVAPDLAPLPWPYGPAHAGRSDEPGRSGQASP